MVKKQERVKVRILDVVVVPRAAFVAAIWEQPFDVLRAMAARNEQGLSLLDLPDNLLRVGDHLEYQIEIDKRGEIVQERRKVQDLALLKRGPEGQALVYGQGW